MRASRLAPRLAAGAAVVQAGSLLLASSAVAAPSPAPDEDPCELIRGPAKEYCEQGQRGGGGGDGPMGSNSLPGDPTAALDPLASLAKGFADAASWTVTKLSELVQETATVDFTNPQFLKQYAVVFAASSAACRCPPPSARPSASCG
jgi:hypothetical protein